MTQIAERHSRLAAAMTERIANVDEEGWSARTPCEDWDARALLHHLVETPAIFFGLVDEAPPPPGPDPDTDPVGAFAHVHDAVASALRDPAIAEREFDGAFGKNTFAGAIDQFICADLVLHGWDLARATGQDEHVDPDDVRVIGEALYPVGDAIRRPGAFGRAVEPPPDADEQTKLLCFLGRPA